MGTRLASVLNALREARFVGRETELALFSSAIAAKSSPFVVLHIYGPGGVGKSTLLRRMAVEAQEAGRFVISVDGESTVPVASQFEAAIREAAGITGETSDFFDSLKQRLTLIIDAYEQLGLIEPWLTQQFFPTLPEGVLIVIASRQMPSATMRSDPAWRGLLKAMPLRNLTQKESNDLLELTSIPEAQRKAVIQFTHGHPLALSLVADLYEFAPGSDFDPDSSPEVVQRLVERFLDDVPSDDHRAALQACALPRVTTEALLARLLNVESAAEQFAWLRGLSFIEQRREGIAPHDLAREVIMADMRWRDANLSKQIHDRARSYYKEKLSTLSGAEQQGLLFDYIFLHRDNPVVRPFFDWEQANSVRATHMEPGDAAALVELVRKNEGDESAVLAEAWIKAQPDRTIVFRTTENLNEPAGFVTMLSLKAADSRQILADPAMTMAHRHLAEKAPLREGEDAIVFRFWMSASDYQLVSPVQSQIFVAIVRCSISGAAHTFLPVRDSEFWTPLFKYAELKRLPSADFSVGDRCYGMFGHDWRKLPPIPWLELLGEKETGSEPAERTVGGSSEVLVLSREDFDQAVESALKGYVSPAQSAENPLVRSKLVLDRINMGNTASQRLAALRAALLECAQAMKGHPKSAKFYRALHVAYFHPVATQELAAQKLDISLSSFRRHLRDGIAELSDSLWQAEIGLA